MQKYAGEIKLLSHFEIVGMSGREENPTRAYNQGEPMWFHARMVSY